jgi:RNA polymerase sigma-70 factor (ECF subfamily)
MAEGSEKTSRDHVTEVQQLFLRYANVVRGFIVGLVVDLNVAEDILQEVFLTVTDKAADYELGTNFLAWAQTIAHLKVLEHRREKRRSPQPFSPEVFDALASSAPSDPTEHADRRKALRECVAKLGKAARRILELRYSDRMSSREISQTMSWKATAVDVALSKARRFLRDCTRTRLGTAGEAR